MGLWGHHFQMVVFCPWRMGKNGDAQLASWSKFERFTSHLSLDHCIMIKVRFDTLWPWQWRKNEWKIGLQLFHSYWTSELTIYHWYQLLDSILWDSSDPNNLDQVNNQRLQVLDKAVVSLQQHCTLASLFVGQWSAKTIIGEVRSLIEQMFQTQGQIQEMTGFTGSIRVSLQRKTHSSASSAVMHCAWTRRRGVEIRGWFSLVFQGFLLILGSLRFNQQLDVLPTTSAFKQTFHGTFLAATRWILGSNDEGTHLKVPGLVNIQKTHGKITIFWWENPLFQWPCSIAMLVITRGCLVYRSIQKPCSIRRWRWRTRAVLSLITCSETSGDVPPITRPGKHTKNYGKSPCLMGISTISMASFNSYVSLPEDRWSMVSLDDQPHWKVGVKRNFSIEEKSLQVAPQWLEKYPALVLHIFVGQL